MSRTLDRFVSTQLLEAFSRTVLELNHLARDQSLECFHAQALQRLQPLIPFDKAWWGRAALINDMPEEHSSHLYRLPESYVADWQSMRHDDVTVGLVHAEPGRSVIVDTRAAEATPGLRWLGERHGFGELLCVVCTDPKTRLIDHLTLYRAPSAKPFSGSDQLLLDALMPHLASAVSSNQIRTLVAQRERLSVGHNLALAVSDGFGILHCAEEGFVRLLLREWPDWSGPALPVLPGREGFRGDSLELDVTQVTDLYLITARSRGAMTRLSARERDVAQRFGEGLTYKEVARDLGVSPNTVRHHLRSIYTKLGVSGKAGIAQLLHQHSPD